MDDCQLLIITHKEYIFISITHHNNVVKSGIKFQTISFAILFPSLAFLSLLKLEKREEMSRGYDERFATENDNRDSFFAQEIFED